MAKRKKFNVGQKFGDLGKPQKDEQQADLEQPPPQKKEPSKPVKANRKTKAGELRYTIVIDPDLLERIREVSRETGLPIKKLFAVGMEKYLAEKWTEEKLQAWLAENEDFL